MRGSVFGCSQGVKFHPPLTATPSDKDKPAPPSPLSAAGTRSLETDEPPVHADPKQPRAT